MNYKFLALTISLTFLSNSQAASRNLCDDLIDANNSSKEDIENCQKQFGISDFYKSQKVRVATEAETSAAATIEAKKKAENIEEKYFTAAELNKAGFGQPFFARTDDYRSGREMHEELTSRDNLCVYLGFEKAKFKESEKDLSEQLTQPQSNNRGLILSTSFFNKTPKPELYKQDNPKVGVRKYNSIACIRRKDKAIDPDSEGLKNAVRQIELADQSINQAPVDTTIQILDTKRGGKKTTTPHGYKTPDWMKNDSTAK